MIDTAPRIRNQRPVRRNDTCHGVLRVVTLVLAILSSFPLAAQDLSIQLTLGQTDRLRGESATINFVVANPTTVDADRYRVDFYGSRDTVLDDDDTLLGAFDSEDPIRGNSFQENSIALHTCDLALGAWRIIGRITDTQPPDPNPENDGDVTREVLSLSRDDDDPLTCPERQPHAKTINPGLNDAWFNPDIIGQGFLVTVFGDSGNVFLAWFTFDSTPTATGATAIIGDASQRWLTAFGAFEGNSAVLEVTNTRGGRFDRENPGPINEPYGTLILSFENCHRGMVTYDLPGPGLAGVIPIERVVEDNIALCERLAASFSTR
jgi:hypothetical protein